MDHSGSMAATDVAPSRLTAALDAGDAFLDKVPKRVRVGGVVFDNVAEAVQSPTIDRATLRQALKDAMKPSGGTATGDALAASLQMIKTAGKKAPGAIVLLSDGKETHGRDPLPSPTRRSSSASRSTPSRSAPRPARCPTATPSRPTRRRSSRSPTAPAASRSPPPTRTRSARSTRSSAPRSR